MVWFEINGNQIVSNEINPWGEHACWGIYLGGRWCLDYTWKLMFGISTEDWKTKCGNLKTDKDFYDFCDWLGVYYLKNDIIYCKGKKYDKYGRKLENNLN